MLSEIIQTLEDRVLLENGETMHNKNNKGLQVNEVPINDNNLKNWKKTQYGG